MFINSILYGALLAFLVVILPSLSTADLPSYCSDSNHRKNVTIEFPDGNISKTAVSLRDIAHTFKANTMPKKIELSTYKLDKWVYTAFQKMKLNFDGHTIKGEMRKDGTFFRETIITRIGNYENGPSGEWALYVNGDKSKHPIDTLIDGCSIKTIRFVYVPKPGAPPPTPLIPIH